MKHLGQLSLLSSSYCLLFIKARCTIFEIASDFNITMFPSIVKSLILHTLKTFLILAIMVIKKIFLLQAFLLQEKGFLRILTISLFKWVHYMLPSATLTSFRAHIPTIA